MTEDDWLTDKWMEELLEENKVVLAELQKSEERDIHLALIKQVQEILSITIKLGSKDNA